MSTYEIELRSIVPRSTAAMVATVDVEHMPAFLGRAYGAVAGYLARIGAGPAGMPYARYHVLGEGRFEVEAGFPATRTVPGEGDVIPSSLPGGEAAVTMHVGPYEEMTSAYRAIEAWLSEHDATAKGDAWEVYYSDPGSQPDPANWRTEIVQPVTRPSASPNVAGT